MITASNLLSKTVQPKKCVLLMDTNPERRTLRKKIMALHGVQMIGASDLEEAALVWHPDRYDMVLIDIRRDYHGALALRDEIKRDSPDQIVAFLVGRPILSPFSPPWAPMFPKTWDGVRRVVAQCGQGELRIATPEEWIRGSKLEDCRNQGAQWPPPTAVEDSLSASVEPVLEEVAG